MITYVVVTKNQDRIADFQTFAGMQYLAAQSYNLLENITSKSLNSLTKCVARCLGYPLCETATFYQQKQICVLYQERYGLGQLVNVGTRIASTMSLVYRVPAGNVKNKSDAKLSYLFSSSEQILIIRETF